jgi:myo-inositol-1(or 4)-monophosphatase
LWNALDCDKDNEYASEGLLMRAEDTNIGEGDQFYIGDKAVETDGRLHDWHVLTSPVSIVKPDQGEMRQPSLWAKRGLEYELGIAKKLARAAGKALRSFNPYNVQIGPSARSSAMVTIPDLIADDIIVSGLQLAFPYDAVCSEQTPVSYGPFEGDRLWLVDALDGNTSLVDHGDEYAVSIGLAVRGQAVLGVVYNPVRDELFAGAEDIPTTLNGFPLQASRTDQFSGASISMPHSEWTYSTNLPELPPIRPIVSTSYELARVAAGMEDGFFSVLPVREWSTCAGVALIRAAGCRATLHGGIEILYNNSDLTHPLGIIAARLDLHDSLNNTLTSSLKIDEGTLPRNRRPSQDASEV